MRKIRKLFLSVLTALCLAVGAFAFVSLPVAKAQTVQYMDMYLIAGQSNAVGYSAIPAGMTETFGNIMYAGQVNCEIGKTAGSNDYITALAAGVQPGLGRSNQYIGPEYGMAKVLNELYSADRPAMIFKSAAGGTALRNTNSGNSAIYGNWLPPSAREDATPNAATGVQYDKFMANFRTVTDTLKTAGYTPRVKGMIWMQGEDDRSAPAEYKPLITALIADMRADLSAITCDDLTDMPFVMGEISDTFSTYDNLAVNQAFNAMLRTVPETVPHTGVIASGKYVINNRDGTLSGTDRYHWNGNDMLEIGQLFADKLLELSEEKTIRSDTQTSGTLVFSQGTVDFTVADGQITLTPVPDDGCRLYELQVNGQPLNPSTDGAYTVPAGGNVTVKAMFSPLPLYKITYQIDVSMGTLVYDGDTYCKRFYTENSPIVVKVAPKPGYETESVTFNGAALNYDEQTGLYTSQPITEAGEVTVTFRKIAQPTTPDEPTEPAEKKSCGGSLALLASFLSVAGLAVLFLKKV